MANLRKPFLACSGTHDITASGHSSLEIFRNPERGWVVDSYVRFAPSPMSEFVFVMVPDRMSVADQQENLEGKVEEAKSAYPGKRIIVLTHGDVNGLEFDPSVQTGLDLKRVERDVAFFMIGHLHNPPAHGEITRDVISDPNKVLFLGTSMPHSFGDVHPGVVYDVEFPVSTATRVASSYPYVREIIFPHPVFKTVRLPTAGMPFPDLDRDDFYSFVLGPGVAAPDLPEWVKHVTGSSEVVGGNLEEMEIDEGAFDEMSLIESYVNARRPEALMGEKLIEIGKMLAGNVVVDEAMARIEELLS